MSNIKIYINSEWINARDYQINAYNEYKNRCKYSEQIFIYNNNDIKFTIQRQDNNPYNPLYLIREDNSRSPIIDFNDIKHFIDGNWSIINNNLKDAYIDYIYDNQEIKYYHNFSISRNTNRSIYYKLINSDYQIRISDNGPTRINYQGYYNRLTMDVGLIVDVIPNIINYLEMPPNIIIEYTDNNDIMCTICNEIKQNIRFIPCNHTNTCSKCYHKLTKPFECPLCKSIIQEINII